MSHCSFHEDNLPHPVFPLFLLNFILFEFGVVRGFTGVGRMQRMGDGWDHRTHDGRDTKNKQKKFLKSDTFLEKEVKMVGEKMGTGYKKGEGRHTMLCILYTMCIILHYLSLAHIQ